MDKLKRGASLSLNRINRLVFDSYVLASWTGKKHILCLGDSHIRVFRYLSKYRCPPNCHFDVVSVVGATAQGAVNPNSKTNALSIFRQRLYNIKSWQYIFLQLGEVDCGFVIWYRANKYGNSVQSQLNRSIDNYCLFLREVQAKVGDKVFVLSAPLPTIQDNQSWGNVANARKEVNASQRERTNLTMQYNQKLMLKCQSLGINFLDITSEQIDSEKGVIKDKFINHDRLDHHLNNDEYSKLILKKIKNITS